MHLQTRLKVGAAILLTGILAACGSNSNPAPRTATSPNNTLATQFGSEFATIFDAASTAQPATPDSNAVPPLQPADQPVQNPASS